MLNNRLNNINKWLDFSLLDDNIDTRARIGTSKYPGGIAV